MTTASLSWGILGTGAIAKTFARALPHSRTGKLVAIGSRTPESAAKFHEVFPAVRAHGSYEDLLADPEVQAVYISTPHPSHAEWAIKAAEAGKHILCEKPVALNHAEAMAVVEAAETNEVFFMEAFMYRCHPQTARVVNLIKSGAIGELKMIQATFSFRGGNNLEGRLLNNELGGGGILDVGCYTVSAARLFAGAALGLPYADPIKCVAVGHVGEASQVDEYSAAALEFPGKIMAQVSCGVQLSQDNSVRLFGTEGWIHLPNLFVPAREGGSVFFTIHKKEEAERVDAGTTEWLYAMEADAVSDSLAEKQSPAMSWEDTLGNMRVLDHWRRELGVSYRQETARGSKSTVRGSALRFSRSGPIPHATPPGWNKSISRLVMGVDNQHQYQHAAVMFDNYVEKGGNAFDTAWIYDGGAMERLLGEWITARGIREELFVIGKGGHTPHCNPERISRQLSETLDRLKTDHVDLYLMHRDDPQVPVGEFVDVLNEHHSAGRVRAFGGSNWSIERVEAANSYAAANGKVGFSAVSNNFSLARMVKPVWSGCISASDRFSRDWFQKTQIPLFAWSSQARGFFLETTHPGNLTDESLVRCWFSDDNFVRLERARELAAKKGVLPINIALAYVLNQPFPTFALFGPRKLSETRTSLPGAALDLTPEEMSWLNLGE